MLLLPEEWAGREATCISRMVGVAPVAGSTRTLKVCVAASALSAALALSLRE